MSMQMCHCGWSKVTSYQGLRTHQGKMGCTPKGVKIPESELFRYAPIREPSRSIFLSSLQSDDQQLNIERAIKELQQTDDWSIDWNAPVKKEPLQMIFGSQANPGTAGVAAKEANGSLQETQQNVLPTATNSETTHAAFNLFSFEEPLKMIFGSQANPGTAGVAAKEANGSLQETRQNFLPPATKSETTQPTFVLPSFPQPLKMIFGSQANPATAGVTANEPNGSVQETQRNFLPTATKSETTQPTFVFPSLSKPVMSQVIITQKNPEPAKVAVKEANRSLQETQQNFLPKSETTHSAFDLLSFSQPVMSQVINTQKNPEPAKVAVKKTDRSTFETPPRDSMSQLTGGNARRSLDFQPAAQVGQLPWDLPITAAQETPAVRPKESKEDKEQKVWQDRIRANLQQKIQARQQKIAEVKSSVKDCKCDLDAEWVEINDVFSQAIRVMEDARQKALQPLEDRRQRVKRDARDLVQTLQTEIDKLKKSIDELEKNPDLQASPLTDPGETCDLAVDTSLSFGSLRATTSNMMQRIHQELEKLSSVELRRMPTFAVDVKLDPTSAHPWLVLSPSGKTVRDGGKNQRVPDAPQRFDMFGSILGMNSLTSGRSYWEVEVANKTGWDLGVARRSANRKGKLALTPSGGYWVAVHYQGDKYAALAKPPVSLALPERPRRVGVFVDYEEGLVSFYDVTARSHIHSFTKCSFGGEILPYFSPHLKEKEKNSQPLVISAVAKQW